VDQQARIGERRAIALTLYLTKDGEKALAQIKSLAKQHEAQLAAFIGQRRRQQLLDLLREFG